MMEIIDCATIVISRIQRLEPENAMKISGYVLLKCTEKEIMELAYCHDNQILFLINEAKAHLTSSFKSYTPRPMQPLDQQFHHISSPTVPRHISLPTGFHAEAPMFDPKIPSHQMPLSGDIESSTSSCTDLIGGVPLSHDVESSLYSHTDLIGGLDHQIEHLGLEDQPHSLHPSHGHSKNYQLSKTVVKGVSGSNKYKRLGQNPELFDSSSKACHYYNKGYCKNGSKCPFFHGPIFHNRFSNIHNPNLNEFGNEDCDVSSGSLADLELEIIELIKSKSGTPISITSLPTMYFEKYGKMLQVDGFLTGSQRLGKPGCSLTKLLKQLNNSIQLIYRPHGQDFVILAEDASKYIQMDQRIDQGLANAFSTQIYITFPFESSFTADDVVKYFNQYGPVRFVRIPHQEKRMFGFVSFVKSETVKAVLAMGYSHYICGARVLAKPYREKTKLTDKNAEKMESSQYLTMDKKLDTRGPLLLERGPLFQQKLSPNRETPQSHFSRFTEDDGKRQSAVLRSDLISESISKEDSNRNTDTDSDHIDLPDSPFSFPWQ